MRRSALGARRSALGARRSALGDSFYSRSHSTAGGFAGKRDSAGRSRKPLRKPHRRISLNVRIVLEQSAAA
ncbi:MAG: hypothetical protein F4X97_13885 [Boseongicola sp. SB0662_bin_57]|nr:hypothetical protein [Boseongicola sp. SB0662_bin_57]